MAIDIAPGLKDMLTVDHSSRRIKDDTCILRDSSSVPH